MGFRNDGLLSSAHPSDRRMPAWAPATDTVGSIPLDAFTSAQWRDINSPTRIDFALTANEVRDFHLRVFISLAQPGGSTTGKRPLS